MAVAFAGLGGAAAAGHATGWSGADLALRGAFAATVAIAASRARRWTWIVPAVTGLLAARDWRLAVLAALALGLTGVGFLAGRSRLLGAAIGGLAVNVLLRLPRLGPFGTTAILVTAATVPVLLSAYRRSGRSSRARLRLAAVCLAGAAAGGSAAFAFSLLAARPLLETGMARAAAGISSVQAQQQQQSAAAFADAANSLASAHERLHTWWVRPAQLVPVIGAQVRALDTATARGADLAKTSAEAMRNWT